MNKFQMIIGTLIGLYGIFMMIFSTREVFRLIGHMHYFLNAMTNEDCNARPKSEYMNAIRYCASATSALQAYIYRIIGVFILLLVWLLASLFVF